MNRTVESEFNDEQIIDCYIAQHTLQMKTARRIMYNTREREWKSKTKSNFINDPNRGFATKYSINICIPAKCNRFTDISVLYLHRISAVHFPETVPSDHHRHRHHEQCQ